MTVEVIDSPKAVRPPPTLVSAAIRTHLMQVVHAYTDLDLGRNTLRARRVKWAVDRLNAGETSEDLAPRSAVHAALVADPQSSAPTELAIKVVRRAFGTITSNLYTNEQLLDVIAKEFGVTQKFDYTHARSLLVGVRVTP